MLQELKSFFRNLRYWFYRETARDKVFQDIERFNWAMNLEFDHYIKRLRFKWQTCSINQHDEILDKYRFTFPATKRECKFEDDIYDWYGLEINLDD